MFSALMTPASAHFPTAPLLDIDTLWFQVAGTLCNLKCSHCFISCSPTNHAHEMLSLATVKRFLAEAEAMGVREYYFTGGEPFLNPEMVEILEAALGLGPVSVLTNGLLLKPELVSRLKALSDASPYSFDVRISIDGYDADTNDPIRGAGTFRRIMEGVKHLSDGGLNPVITVTEACEAAATNEGRVRFLELLKSIGLMRPRLKIMPLLRIGAEAERERAYAAWETLKGTELSAGEAGALQCASGRMVTSQGVFVCPILIDFPGARLGETLAEAKRPFLLEYPACFTCHATGFSCRT